MKAWMSYKYRLYPNDDQRKKIDHSIAVCRLVYNLALETKIYAYRSHGKNLSGMDLCYQLVALKKEYPWIAEVDSQALQASVKKLDNAFKWFFQGGKGYPKFKSKKSRQSFQCPNGRRQLDWENSELTIPKISNIPIRLSRKFDGKIKLVTIDKTTTGKYFAYIMVEKITKHPVKPTVSDSKTIGIDVGLKSFVTTSTGKFFEPNRFWAANLKRLKCLQRRACRKKRGSKNKKKAYLKVSKLFEQISDQRGDYIHKITTRLVRDSQTDTFVIEDLNLPGMMKNNNLSRSLRDASFGEFFRQMKYKCDWYGKNIIVIGMFDPSSKRCNDCGAINKDLTFADREWTCSCGSVHDRDLNAAKNIKYYGLLKYSGEGIPGEPVESSALGEMKKQEDILDKNFNVNVKLIPTSLNGQLTKIL